MGLRHSGIADPHIQVVRIERAVVGSDVVVQLRGLRAPAAGVEHPVGRTDPGLAIRWQLPQDRSGAAEARVDREVFDKEAPRLIGHRVKSGERMPPPVITARGQGTGEHVRVAIGHRQHASTVTVRTRDGIGVRRLRFLLPWREAKLRWDTGANRGVS